MDGDRSLTVVMLDFAKVVHEAIGIQSPRAFIIVFGICGLLLFSTLGWLIDKGYRVKLLQEHPKVIEIATPSKATTTESPGFYEGFDRVALNLGGDVHSQSKSMLERRPFEPIGIAGFPSPFKMYVQDNIFYCDVKLFNGPGEPAVEVVKNEFVVRPARWDKNSNTNALEVIDEHGLPVFQLVRTGPGSMAIRGIFGAPGLIFIINDDGMRTVPTMPGKPLATSLRSLKAIFKYPAWKYPGQYEESSK